MRYPVVIVMMQGAMECRTWEVLLTDETLLTVEINDVAERRLVDWR